MKSVFILIFLFTVSSISGQNYFTDSTYSFYPLDIGNYWEYNVYGGPDPIHLEYQTSYWVKVIGDTVLENGKSYKILSRGYFNISSINLSFERIDSATTSVYRFDADGEYKIDSLACSEGDTIQCSRYTHSNLETYCTNVIQRDIFGHNLWVKYLNDFYGIPNVEYELAENIGLIANYSWEIFSHEEYLQYAKIRDIEYGVPVEVASIENSPRKFSLYQNYPNPFNPVTTIRFEIPYKQKVELTIYDFLGREVRTLYNDIAPAGIITVDFNAAGLASGVYIYRLKTDEFISSKKLVILK